MDAYLSILRGLLACSDFFPSRSFREEVGAARSFEYDYEYECLNSILRTPRLENLKRLVARTQDCKGTAR